MDLESKPRLRWTLDVQTVEHEGQLYVVLSDTQDIAPEMATIPHAFLPILGRLDGSTSLASILAEGSEYGLTEEILSSFIEQLDDLLMLDTAKVHQRWIEIKREYRAVQIREAAHAGKVYASDPEELRTQLSEYILKTKSAVTVEPKAREIVALMCPHIDYRRGWHGYGTAYQALAKVERPDVLFLIGTSHQPSTTLFHLTEKDFATPFGVVPTDKKRVSQIADRYGRERSFAEEILHRTEHSLELQLPFIAHRYGSEGMPALVPILVGSFQQFFDGSKSPIEHGEVSDFVDALAESLRELRDSGKRILFYAGVDLSHMGQYFGDEQNVSQSQLSSIEARDLLLMDSLLEANEEKLFAHMAEDRDKRRVCGYPSMYVLLSSLRRAGYQLTGHNLEYRQAVDRSSDCVVSFASAYWTA